MPTSFAALGYDSVMLIAAAIENSDLQNTSSVAEELLKLGPWPGAAGVHKFNEQGDDILDLVALKILRDGKFEHIGR